MAKIDVFQSYSVTHFAGQLFLTLFQVSGAIVSLSSCNRGHFLSSMLQTAVQYTSLAVFGSRRACHTPSVALPTSRENTAHKPVHNAGSKMAQAGISAGYCSAAGRRARATFAESRRCSFQPRDELLDRRGRDASAAVCGPRHMSRKIRNFRLCLLMYPESLAAVDGRTGGVLCGDVGRECGQLCCYRVRWYLYRNMHHLMLSPKRGVASSDFLKDPHDDHDDH